MLTASSVLGTLYSDAGIVREQSYGARACSVSRDVKREDMKLEGQAWRPLIERRVGRLHVSRLHVFRRQVATLAGGGPCMGAPCGRGPFLRFPPPLVLAAPLPLTASGPTETWPLKTAPSSTTSLVALRSP